MPVPLQYIPLHEVTESSVQVVELCYLAREEFLPLAHHLMQLLVLVLVACTCLQVLARREREREKSELFNVQI